MTHMSVGVAPGSVDVIPPLPVPITSEPIQAQQGSLQDINPTLNPLLPTLNPGLIYPIRIRSLRCGCYLINYQPNSSSLVSYDGTLRVECHNEGRTASGDLYQRPIIFFPFPGFPSRPPQPLLLSGPNPANGIPILSRNRYRYYLRVTQILEHFTIGNSFTLGMEMYRFTAPNTWVNEGTVTATMTWSAAPAGYPSGNDYLTGDVRNSSGTVIGRLTMGWVSRYFRKATIEIDRVSASEAPLTSGAGVDWRSIYDRVGWDVTVHESSSSLTEPSGSSWSDAELHQTMLAQRDASNLDTEWRYYLIAVRLLDSTSRGIMYDAYASDSNNVPREGAAISSHWVIPNANPWGLVKGLRFGTATAPYFRTAVHELGHAMGLYHNTVDNGFMNTTPDIASAGTAANPFPNNVQWSYAPDDEKRLRHYPDMFVRPGGVAFGSASSSTPPITPTDLELEMDGLELRVSPVLESVPLGAPVRVNLELVNVSDRPILAPASLNLKMGFVKGKVVDPSGAVKTFLPLVHCVEDHPMTVLEPGQRLTHSLTLLRGGQGALFPTSGLYHVVVEAHWHCQSIEAVVSGETAVLVTGTVDADHAAAAHKILATPDTLLTLVLGGDHLVEGVEAIQTALENPVLHPHFAYIEAKRLAERFGDRKANPKAAKKLIEKSTVMSPTEAKKAATFASEKVS